MFRLVGSPQLLIRIHRVANSKSFRPKRIQSPYSPEIARALPEMNPSLSLLMKSDENATIAQVSVQLYGLRAQTLILIHGQDGYPFIKVG